MAGHEDARVVTGHIGTNTPKFVPPRLGGPRFDPTQTGLCKFGCGFGARWWWYPYDFDALLWPFNSCTRVRGPPVALHLSLHVLQQGFSMGVSKPGGFPLTFRERSRLCRGPFRDCSSQVLVIGWERGRGGIGKIPGPSPSKSRKSWKNQESPKKDEKGQKRKDEHYTPRKPKGPCCTIARQLPEVSHVKLPLKRCRATARCSSYTCECRGTLCNYV